MFTKILRKYIFLFRHPVYAFISFKVRFKLQVQSPDVAAGREVEDVWEEEWQRKEQHVEDDVDDGPREDPARQVLAATTRVAQATIAAHVSTLKFWLHSEK